MKIKYKLLISLAVLILASTLMYNLYLLRGDFGDSRVSQALNTGFKVVEEHFTSFLKSVNLLPTVRESALYGELSPEEIVEKSERTTVSDINRNIIKYTRELVEVEGRVVSFETTDNEENFLLDSDDGYINIFYSFEREEHGVTTIDLNGSKLDENDEVSVYGLFIGTKEHDSRHFSGNIPNIEARYITTPSSHVNGSE